MAELSKEQFTSLLNVHDTHCISIYIPTNRSGKEVNEHHDQIKFNNQIHQIKLQLTSLYNMSEPEVLKFLQPLKQLLEDTFLWRHLSAGLAVFLSKNYFEYYPLPVSVNETTYIADHFYTLPLFSCFNGTGKFFIAALSLHDVRIFECTRDTITALDVSSIPTRLEEEVGFDYEQKITRFSGKTGRANVLYGQNGADQREKKEEIGRYFKAIHDGLMTMMREQKAPLVVACVDYLFGIYKKVNRYPYLYAENVNGNPEELNEKVLHEKAWAMIKHIFNLDCKQQIQVYKDLVNTNIISPSVEKIVPAAIHGQVESLFVKKSEMIWGHYDPAVNKVYVREKRQPADACLLNLAAVKTFLQGGNVYIIDAAEEMPETNTKVNAVFRYTV